MAITTATTIQAPRSIYVDELPDGTIYIGLAKPGSLGSAAVWQIRQLTVLGTQTLVKWANGNEKFINIWDNRASLSYS